MHTVAQIQRRWQHQWRTAVVVVGGSTGLALRHPNKIERSNTSSQAINALYPPPPQHHHSCLAALASIPPRRIGSYIGVHGPPIPPHQAAAAAMGISSMPAPKDSLLTYLLYNAVVSIAALAGVLRAALVFLGLPAPPLSGEDGEGGGGDQLAAFAVSAAAAAAGPSLAERFRSRFRPARFGRRRGAADCRVCLVRFEPEAVVNRLPCGHLFHRACLETWLDYDHATCPLCRSRLLPAADESAPAPRLAWI